MKGTSKTTTKRVVLPPGAVVWKPGDPLPKPLQDEVERQVEDFNRREEEMAGQQLTAFCGPKHWNVSEVLYTVMSYLTAREKPLMLSRNHDAAPVAEILNLIVTANELPACRNGDDWPKLDIPKAVDDIVTGPIACRPYEIEEVYGIIRPLIEVQTYANQNRIVASLLEEMKEHRTYEITRVNQEMEDMQERGDELVKYLGQLDLIIKGEAAVVKPIRAKLPKMDDHG